MQVEVRPLTVKKWHGKEGKESFTQTKVIEVLLDNKTGRYATGLTEEEAKIYGERLGANLSDEFNSESAHPYFSSKAGQIRLENRTMIFDTNKPSDFVKVKNMKASKYVANSMKEFEAGDFPEATHVIFDQQEEVDLKASKIALRDECVLMLSKMDSEDKAAMVQVLSNKTVRGKSDNLIRVEVDTIINEKPAEFIRFVKMGREEVAIRAKVLECIYKNILTKESGSFYYMGELVGIDYEGAVEWFKDPNNQKIKVTILEKLNK